MLPSVQLLLSLRMSRAYTEGRGRERLSSVLKEKLEQGL